MSRGSRFSAQEALGGDCKYHCDTCRAPQEARRRLRVAVAPAVLALHLKRFQFAERLQRLTKRSCRVAFPLELRLPVRMCVCVCVCTRLHRV